MGDTDAKIVEILSNDFVEIIDYNKIDNLVTNKILNVNKRIIREALIEKINKDRGKIKQTDLPEQDKKTNKLIKDTIKGIYDLPFISGLFNNDKISELIDNKNSILRN